MEGLKMGVSGRMSTKGQTTVPRKVREALGLSPDVVLDWQIKGDVAILRAKTKRIQDFAGMLGEPPKGKGLAVEDMDDAVAEAVSEEFERGLSSR